MSLLLGHTVYVWYVDKVLLKTGSRLLWNAKSWMNYSYNLLLCIILFISMLLKPSSRICRGPSTRRCPGPPGFHKSPTRTVDIPSEDCVLMVYAEFLINLEERWLVREESSLSHWLIEIAPLIALSTQVWIDHRVCVYRTCVYVPTQHHMGEVYTMLLCSNRLQICINL